MAKESTKKKTGAVVSDSRSDREKALDTAIAQLEKEFGKGTPRPIWKITRISWLKSRRKSAGLMAFWNHPKQFPKLCRHLQQHL